MAFNLNGIWWMSDKNKILQSIYAVLDEKNEELPGDQQLEKSPDSVLFGQGARLDSLGLVNVVVATEQRIEADFGILISLTDERAMSQKNSPFRTVGTMADYVAILIDEGKDG